MVDIKLIAQVKQRDFTLRPLHYRIHRFLAWADIAAQDSINGNGVHFNPICKINLFDFPKGQICC